MRCSIRAISRSAFASKPIIWPHSRTEEAVSHNYMTEPISGLRAVWKQCSNETLTQIQMNAGNKGVEEEHEDHHTQDRDALHQQHLVCYFVLWKRFLWMERKHDFITQLTVFVLSELSKNFIIVIRSLQESPWLRTLSEVKKKSLPSFATLECFVPSFYPLEKFVCQNQQHFHVKILVLSHCKVWMCDTN